MASMPFAKSRETAGTRTAFMIPNPGDRERPTRSGVAFSIGSINSMRVFSASRRAKRI
jgi:hypothetical protein